MTTDGAGGVPDDIEGALDALQLFANSAHSVRVFELLAEGPTTSSTLAECTGASRSTVARILNEGESRDWIASEGSRYELTYLGESIFEEFHALLRSVEGIRRLGAAVNHLPAPARDLEIRHLLDAEITRRTPDRPGAHVERALELYRTATTYRGLTRIAPDLIVRTLAEEVERGGLDVSGVIEASFVETLLGDPGRVAPWRAFADQVWVYDGSIPLDVHLLDGTVVLWLRAPADEEAYGLLECDHPAVVGWAESLYREYRAGSEPLDPARLPDA
jgi:predicted transcriptional regulator